MLITACLTSRYVKSGIQNVVRHDLKLSKASHVQNWKKWILEVHLCFQLRWVNIILFLEHIAWVHRGLARKCQKKEVFCLPSETWCCEKQKWVESHCILLDFSFPSCYNFNNTFINLASFLFFIFWTIFIWHTLQLFIDFWIYSFGVWKERQQAPVLFAERILGSTVCDYLTRTWKHYFSHFISEGLTPFNTAQEVNDQMEIYPYHPKVFIF